jgi:hypothetical protein
MGGRRNLKTRILQVVNANILPCGGRGRGSWRGRRGDGHCGGRGSWRGRIKIVIRNSRAAPQQRQDCHHDRPARARRAPRSHHLSGFVSVWLPSARLVDGSQGGGVTGVLLPARAAQEEAAVRRASSWTRASSAWVRCCASAGEVGAQTGGQAIPLPSATAGFWLCTTFQPCLPVFSANFAKSSLFAFPSGKNTFRWSRS